MLVVVVPAIVYDGNTQPETAMSELKKFLWVSLAFFGPLVVLFVVGYLWANFGRSDPKPYMAAQREYAHRTPDRHAQELKDIEQELRRRQYRSDPADKDFSDIQKRLEPIEAVARSRREQINRKSWQPGYSLEVRREAAYRTLVELGNSPQEARLTVDAMERQGRRPDPPRQ